MPPKLKKINNNVFYSGKQLLDLTKGTGSEINKEKLKVADRGGILVPIIIDRKEHEAKTLDGNFYGVTLGQDQLSKLKVGPYTKKLYYGQNVNFWLANRIDPNLVIKGSKKGSTLRRFNKKETTSNSEDNILKKAVNKTVYNVTKNLDNFQYNVVIANIHEIYNLFYSHVINNKTSNKTLKNEWEKITMLLVPLTPHLAHECHEKINKKFYWPQYDSKMLQEENCTIVIQVDGRKRGIVEMPINSKEKTIITKSKKIDNVMKYIKNTTIIKNIYIKNKLINFITRK